MAAIARLSGQEYVHTFASARKAQLAGTGEKTTEGKEPPS
jgi:hypothetical protein